MKFAIFPNLQKPQAVSITKKVTAFLYDKGAKVYVEEEKSAILDIPSLDQVSADKIDFMVSIGGDGTILRMIHRFPQIRAPIIGINLGSLGFMAEIPLENIFQSLEDIFEKRYRIQSRIVMQGLMNGEKLSFGVNEIVIHRAKNPSLVDLSIHVDGVYLNTFSADGLIICTPNGSTAYSLAAGGPILAPDLNVLAITPICPHTISNRPIVVSAESEIQIEYLNQYAPIEVSYDGFPLHDLPSGQFMTISLSPRKFDLVIFENHDFFATLRTKLGWALKLKN